MTDATYQCALDNLQPGRRIQESNGTDEYVIMDEEVDRNGLRKLCSLVTGKVIKKHYRTLVYKKQDERTLIFESAPSTPKKNANTAILLETMQGEIQRLRDCIDANRAEIRVLDTEDVDSKVAAALMRNAMSIQKHLAQLVETSQMISILENR